MAIHFRGMLLSDYLDLVASVTSTQNVRVKSDVIGLARDAAELEGQNNDLRMTLANVIRLLENGLERSFELDGKIAELKRKYGLDSKGAFVGVM